MRSEMVRLLKTLPHPCGYFAERTAQNLVIDPLATDLPDLFEIALTRGFRRAGGHIYRPACARCRACIPARVPVAEFRPNRSQRRCLQRNADLSVAVEPAQYTEECHALYARYLRARHAGGGMDEGASEDFTRFLTSGWSPTRFIVLRRGEKLIGVAVTDFTRHGLSAVYTFFEPAEDARGLGTFAVLTQIAMCQREGLPHLYLGYWIEGHRKMDYKARFQPLEIMQGSAWQRLQRAET